MSGRLAVHGDGRLGEALRAALGAGRELPPGPAEPDNLVVLTETGLAPKPLADAGTRLRERGTAGLPVHASWDATTIGPVLLPDQPGCYRCLLTRARAARAGGPAPDREFWQRFATGELSPPEPVLTAGLLAVVAALVAEEHRRLQTGPDPRTRAAVLRVRPDALTIDRHRFLPDPACPVCGGVPDDSAAQAVLTLQPRPAADPVGGRAGPGPDSRALVERYVDRYAGLIHSVRVDYHGSIVNATAAIHARGWSADGSGRSLDRDTSVAVAILEALERYAGTSADLSKRTVVQASYRELPPADTLDPRTLGLPEPDRLPDGYVPFHSDLPLAWVWGWSFRRERPVLVPESIGYYYRRPGPRIAYECSSGCALGGSLEEAILHGIFEVAERDGFLLTWYARLPVGRIDWRSVPDPATRLLAARLEASTGDRLHLLDTTMPEGIPSVAAMVVDEQDRPGHAKAFFGGGAHLSPERAVRSAVQEVALSDGRSRLSGELDEQVRAMLADPDLVTELPHHGWVYCLPEAWPRLAFLSQGPVRSLAEAFPPGSRYVPSADLCDHLRYAVDRYLAAGLDIVVVDQTIPEQRAAGLACVKVVIPGTLPMTFGHQHRRAAGIERLHTVPVTLGHRSAPLPAAEINPHPHPFP